MRHDARDADEIAEKTQKTRRSLARTPLSLRVRPPENMHRALLICGFIVSCSCFQLPMHAVSRRNAALVRMSESDTDAAEETAASSGASSLEEKMASWEASEEEARSKTLGGNLPLIGMPGLPGRMTRTDQPTKADGFDVGMTISGIILFPLCFVVLFFPFFMGSIDVSSVGPPPTS